MADRKHLMIWRPLWIFSAFFTKFAFKHQFTQIFPEEVTRSHYGDNYDLFRSSHAEVFLEKGVLKICSKFTGEYPCWSAILKKLQSNFIEIVLRHGCSAVNLLHIFRTFSLRRLLADCFWFVALLKKRKIAKILKLASHFNKKDFFSTKLMNILVSVCNCLLFMVSLLKYSYNAIITILRRSHNIIQIWEKKKKHRDVFGSNHKNL